MPPKIVRLFHRNRLADGLEHGRARPSNRVGGSWRAGIRSSLAISWNRLSKVARPGSARSSWSSARSMVGEAGVSGKAQEPHPGPITPRVALASSPTAAGVSPSLRACPRDGPPIG